MKSRLMIGAAGAMLLLSLSACSDIFDGGDDPTPAPPPPTQEEVQLPDSLSRDKNAAYLAEHAKQAGVKVTPTGLHYREITAGSGKIPWPTANVTVHYRGTFIDGREFDSSYGGEPAQFPLNRVIKGWTEGLQLMKEGGKAELVVPYQIAYGPEGRGEIPPYQTLVFEVQLLKVE
jgi:FKBP-type peptidyl-prolyl cis-trans isomerase